MLLITRIDFKNYKFFSEIPREMKAGKSALSVYIEGAEFSEAFRKFGWDGYHKFYTKQDVFEVGLLDELIFHLKDQEINYEVIEKDFRKFVISDIQKNEKLRPHQNEGVHAFFSKNIGIMKVPTRGGKTFISGEIIRQIQLVNRDCTVLFYVDTVDLFDQTVSELSKFLNVQEKSIGTINSLGVKIKPITVAMIQTVTSIYSRKKKALIKELDLYFKSLCCLIVDEIQEFMSDNRLKLLRKPKNLTFLLGLSATPFKQNNIVGNLNIKGFFGDIVYDVTIERLQSEGWLALDKVILISHENHRKIRVKKEDSKYHLYLKHFIHEDEDRNIILLELIKICTINKWKTLVLFNSKEHGNIISQLSGVNFISGDDNTKVRNENKDNFLRGRGKVLLASNIWKKGITLPEVEILIIADGGLESSTIMQKKGRMLGAVENKSKAVMIDVMDIEPVYFSEHSMNRLETYVETVGNDRIEIYDEFDLSSVEESIREWFDEK